MKIDLLGTACGDFTNKGGAAWAVGLVTCERLLANDGPPVEREGLLELRRNVRVGAKAGNLNFAFEFIGGNSEQTCRILILDADGQLEACPDNRDAQARWDQLQAACVPHPDAAFLQTRQAGNPAQTGFAGVMSPWVEMHFDTLVWLRGWNSGGFRMLYGHGAVIPMAAWQRCRDAGREWRRAGEVVEPGDGGFPEIVTEDLAYTLRCRELGMRGVYLPEITCYEDFPETWGQLRKRADKWIRGAGQCLVYYCNDLPDRPGCVLWVSSVVKISGDPNPGFICKLEGAAPA